MSAASVKQKRSSPSIAKAYGVQPKTRTSSWRLAALAAPSGRGGAQTPTEGKGPGSARPRAAQRRSSSARSGRAA